MPASLPSDSAASANGRLGRGARTPTPVHGMQLNRYTEFLLSDHQEARRIRLLGRLKAAAADHAQLDRWWQHLAGGVPLPDADRYRLEELRADDLTVVLARRRFEHHVRAAGAPDYRYPNDYAGSATAVQPSLLAAGVAAPAGASSTPRIGIRSVDQHWMPVVDATGLGEWVAAQRAHLLLIEADDQATIAAARLARQRLVDEQARLRAALEAIPDGPDPQPAATRQNEVLAEQLRWTRRDLTELGHALQQAEHRQLRLLLATQTDRAKVAALMTMVSDDRGLLSPADIEDDPPGVDGVEHFTVAQLRNGIAAAVANLQALPASRTAEVAAVRADLERLAAYRRDHDQVLAADGVNGSARRRPWARRSPQVSEQQHAADRIHRRWQELSDRLDRLTSDEAARAAAIEAARPSVRLGVACVSQLGARQDAAIEAVTRRPPSYVVAELGHPPATDPARAVWQEGLYLIECYRLDHDITDPDQPLGAAPPTRRAEALSHQLTTARLDALRAELGLPDHTGPNQSRLMDLFDAP